LIRNFKYRLYPTSSEITRIAEQLTEARRLYNCALEHRITVYKMTGESVGYYTQAAELKQIRAEGICKLANFSACQDVLRKLDKTYKAFFGRIKKGKKAGFPRFKNAQRFRTITFPSYGDGCKLTGSHIYLQGMGDIKIRLHRPVEGTIKTVSVTEKNGKYYVCFACEVQPGPLPETGYNKSIGIDMGLESFAVTSDGEFIKNPRHFKTSQKRLRVLQRSVARKKKGSNSRKEAVRLLTNQFEKVANQRKNFLNKESLKIIQQNDIICIEDLSIKGMTARCKPVQDETGRYLPNGQSRKSGLNRSINDAAWGMFFGMLTFKAENAGRELIRVNPRGTSQRCYRCGTTVHKELYDRWHDCPVCGLSIHRDLNSALEILRLGTDPCPVTWNSGSCVGLEAD